ncbi:DUF4296 domain-containing protein [Flavobacterium sp.]|jgi:hypothetical protein|uniref:DUF4296 domain-containing protein n=1 Tax=Flavobacterium sp. TaxID=239 RepID=UPI0037BF3C26
MKKGILFFCAICLLSCSTNPVAKPDHLLDKEVMTDILFDLAVLQAADGVMSHKLVQNNININTFIYKKYAIDSVTYYQNQRYYAADIVKYKKMHQEVLDRLDEIKKETELMPQTKDPVKKPRAKKSLFEQK